MVEHEEYREMALLSAASVVAMAGDTVQMSPVAMLMIHDPSTVAMGNTKDMEKAIEVLTEVKESIINAYAAKSGLSHARIANLMHWGISMSTGTKPTITS